MPHESKIFNYYKQWAVDWIDKDMHAYSHIYMYHCRFAQGLEFKYIYDSSVSIGETEPS